MNKRHVAGPAIDAEKVALLRGTAPFGGLVESDLRQLAASAAWVRFEKGATIFRQGDPGDCAYAIKSGDVSVNLISPEGRQLVLGFMYPGEVMGEIAALDGSTRTAECIAVTEVLALHIRSADLLRLLERPTAAVEMVRMLCRQLRKSTSTIETLTFYQLEARLARLLLGMVRGEDPRDSVASARLLQLSQSKLGLMVNASRPKVNKQLREWQEQGIIEIGEGEVRVLDRERLVERALRL